MTELDNGRGASVEFRDIGMSYGRFEAIKGFNLNIEAGEFLTLLGPSGSGKTTVLNMIAGFVAPAAGDILIGGQSIKSIPTHKRNVGMVFQNYSLFPHMNVLENVTFPLRMRHAPQEVIAKRAEHALGLVHLSDYASRMPQQLSGGQRQRVAFARAIVFEPKVLLMDEPLGALDLKLREHMQLEIKHYQQLIGCTVIYVTHDQNEALTLSDRIVIMNKGDIVQMGPPKSIYDRPESRFAAEFVGETNILSLSPDGRQWRIREIGSSIDGPVCATSRAISHLSIRPEKIARVSDQSGDSDQDVRFPAKIESVVFLGDVIRYVARVEDGSVVKFKEHRTGATAALQPDDMVRLGFLHSDAVFLGGES